jgi:ABC-type Fe3+/spermidine/putrescine transport system ATPase subunit
MSLSDRIVVMNSGCVEQVGTPEEIYARPASLFVAGFVGQVNALPGRIVGQVDGAMVIDTLGAPVKVTPRPLPGADVLVLVRPEAVRVCAPEGCARTGTVEEVEYRGDRIEYRVRASGMLVTAVEASLHRRARIAPGDRVGFELMDEALHVLPEERSRGDVEHADAVLAGTPSVAAA